MSRSRTSLPGEERTPTAKEPRHRRARAWLRRRWRHCVGAAGVLLAAAGITALALDAMFPFPIARLESWPRSPQVLSREGETLFAQVGSDEQWRVPVALEEMSPWLAMATIAVEDERFYAHPGVDPAAILRASGQNLSAGRVVSGASTLTMQIARMTTPQARTWRAKVVEAFRALQLERAWSKEQVLQTYLNIAPYGGNVRGVEAAARIYFGKASGDLSLSEAALISGLPQSPARLRPDRYPERALARRDTVLRRMREAGFISETECRNALADAPKFVSSSEGRRAWLARAAPAPLHAAQLALQRRSEGGHTTISMPIQRAVARRSMVHARSLPRGSDLAVVVIDIATGELIALVGSAEPTDPVDGQVNGATARRSPGSTLKPFVFAAAFATRRLGPDSLIPGGPIDLSGWRPQNFGREFSGEVTAADALRRSLNLPAIRVAKAVGLQRCVGTLAAAGLTLPLETAAQSGLALVTGATETTLLDLTNTYATLGRGGMHRPVKMFLGDAPACEPESTARRAIPSEVRAIPSEVCAAIDQILSCRQRTPHGQSTASDLPWFMWKTGTSSGRRDAWAVGHDRTVAIGVWVGHFSGAPHNEFVGASAAEPLLAELFLLPCIRRAMAQPVVADPLAVESLLPADPVHASSREEPWAVSDPFRFSAAATSADFTALPVRITSPRSGASFVAFEDTSLVELRVHSEQPGLWFLNGLALSGTPSSLRVPPGKHEVRFVDQEGRAAAHTFEVTALQRASGP